MPFTSISAGWIFTLMGLLDDGRPLNQGKSQILIDMIAAHGQQPYPLQCLHRTVI